MAEFHQKLDFHFFAFSPKIGSTNKGSYYLWRLDEWRLGPPWSPVVWWSGGLSSDFDLVVVWWSGGLVVWWCGGLGWWSGGLVVWAGGRKYHDL